MFLKLAYICPRSEASRANICLKNSSNFRGETIQICQEMQVNEMHALYDKHHKVSHFLLRHQNTHNSVKYEVK